MPKASDILIECLEAEGVRFVFGIPGEETLDLNESLDRSSIEFVPVRHEQAGAFIADVCGRLTGQAGVCLGTLGPGATNLVTGVADAYLDRAPLVALTGQVDLERMHKESHQHLDVLEIMRPITKWNARVSDPAIIPEVVRKAFKVAEAEKPGATHLELPEDVMRSECDARPLPVNRTVQPGPADADVLLAAQAIRRARRPIVLAGNGVVRRHTSDALRRFASTTGLRVAETFMGKGLVGADDPRSLGAVGLQAGDYAMAGFDGADLVIAVGYDLVEHDPRFWNPDGDLRIVCIDSLAAEIDAHFVPEVELIGDVATTLDRLAEECGPLADVGGSDRLRTLVGGWLARRATRLDLPHAPAADPVRVAAHVGPRRPAGVRRRAAQVVDRPHVSAYEPNSVLIANGLAGMGFAVPAAIAAKFVQPDRHVVAVSGDGGFMMNCQELETAVRCGTPFVNLVWENRQFGSIAWKQDRRFDRHFGTDFGNPDFVELGRAFGLPSWRVQSADELGPRLTHALTLDQPSLIVVPVDYSLDVSIADELGEEIIPT